jgi:tetratricopeptide (TPR) repeat protein
MHAPVLQAVLNAFDAALDTGLSRLLITSRFPFSLDGLQGQLFELPVPPLSAAAQRKLALRQKEAAAVAGLSATAFEEHEALLERVPKIARGNPGLQDLIGQKFVLSAAVSTVYTNQTLDELEVWLRRGDLPTDPDVRQFLEDLAIDRLIGLVTRSELGLLRKFTLFNVPIPQRVAQALASTSDASLEHLCDLGLIEEFTDLVKHRQLAFAINRLTAGRVEVLTDNEMGEVARAVVHDLFIAWGGIEDSNLRPLACNAQLSNLAQLAEDGEVLAACVADVVAHFRGSARFVGTDAIVLGAASGALLLGQEALRIIHTQNLELPWQLVSETAQAALTSGLGDLGDRLLVRALVALEFQRQSGIQIDWTAAGALVLELTRRFTIRGAVDGVKEQLANVRRWADAAGNEFTAARACLALASVLRQRGELDEALRILRQEALPIYQRHGDARGRARTLCEIAEILVRHGEIDEALRILREEALPVYDRVGDKRERAMTLGAIADIHVIRDELDEALRIRREEVLPVCERLGDAHERAISWGRIADIHVTRDELAEALRIRQEEELPVHERLGNVLERTLTLGKIADIYELRGKFDEALRIRRDEELPVYTRLGEAQGRAITLGKIADILATRGELDEALRILRTEALPILEQLRDVRYRAIVFGRIADILERRGELDECLRIRLQEELPVYQRLGDKRHLSITLGKIAMMRVGPGNGGRPN